MGMYDTYRAAALYELDQEADLIAQNIGNEYNAALTGAAYNRTDPRIADAAYEQKMAALQAMIADRVAAIDAEFGAKEAEHARIAALPMRGGSARQQRVAPSLGTPYQVAAPADDEADEQDESGESFLSSLLSWFR